MSEGMNSDDSDDSRVDIIDNSVHNHNSDNLNDKLEENINGSDSVEKDNCSLNIDDVSICSKSENKINESLRSDLSAENIALNGDIKLLNNNSCDTKSKISDNEDNKSNSSSNVSPINNSSSSLNDDPKPDKTLPQSSLKSTVSNTANIQISIGEILSSKNSFDKKFDFIKHIILSKNATNAEIINGLLFMLVGGPFDNETNFVITSPECIAHMVNVLDGCPDALKVDVWNVFIDIVRKSRRNLITSCVDLDLITRLLHQLPSAGDHVGDLVAELLGMLASFSVTVKELKTLFGLLRKHNGKWPRHSVKLLTVLKQMPLRYGPDEFFIFPGTPGSALSIPPISRWPHQNGWTFNCWFLLDTAAGANSDRDKPYLYCFRSSKGVGYSGHFIGKSLVITTMKMKGKGFQHCIQFEFQSSKWYMISIVHVYNRWSKSEIRCHVDGQLVSQAEMPWVVSTTDVYDRCLIGSNPDQDVCTLFCGQISSVYVFGLGLSQHQVYAIFALGPAYKGQFRFEQECPARVAELHRRALYDTKLHSSLLFTYNPMACDRQLCLDQSPKSNPSIFAHSPHALMTGDVRPVITRSIHSALHSLGGIQIFFPLFKQLKCPQELAGPSTPIYNISALLLSIICDLVSRSARMRHELVQSQGCLVLSRCLHEAGQRQCLGGSVNSATLETLLRTTRFLGSQGARGYALLRHLERHLLCNPALWIRSPFQVQIRLYNFLATDFLSSSDMPIYSSRRLSAVLVALHTLKYYYWVVLPDSRADYKSKAPVDAARPDLPKLATIRASILVYMKHLIIRDNGIQDDELQAILNFLVTVNQDDNRRDVLYFLVTLMADHPSTLVPAFDRKHGLRQIVKLVGSADETVRIHSLKLIGFFLMRSSHKRKHESMTPHNLFSLIGDRLMRHAPFLTMATYNALFELITERLSLIISEKRHDDPDPSCRIENSAVIKVTAHMIQQSKTTNELNRVRRLFLSDLTHLCLNCKENRRLILQMSVWQDWLFGLARIYPSAPDEEKVTDLVMGLFRILLHHALKLEFGGWRVWVDTLAILHARVAFEDYRIKMIQMYRSYEEQRHTDTHSDPAATRENSCQSHHHSNCPTQTASLTTPDVMLPPNPWHFQGKTVHQGAPVVREEEERSPGHVIGSEVDLSEGAAARSMLQVTSGEARHPSPGSQSSGHNSEQDQSPQPVQPSVDSPQSSSPCHPTTKASASGGPVSPLSVSNSSPASSSYVSPASTNVTVTSDTRRGSARHQANNNNKENSATHQHYPHTDQEYHECHTSPASNHDYSRPHSSSTNHSEERSRDQGARMFSPGPRAPPFRIPDFSWSYLHQKLLSDILFSIETDLQVWKSQGSKQILMHVNTPDNLVYVHNLIHFVSQLSDTLVTASGGLLSLLAAATSPNGEVDVLESSQGLKMSSSMSFLLRLMNIADLVMFASAHNFSDLETEKNMAEGGLLRQCLRLVCTCAVRNCLETRYQQLYPCPGGLLNLLQSGDPKSTSTFASLAPAVRELLIGLRPSSGNSTASSVRDPDSLLQDMDVNRLRAVVYRDLEETKLAQFLALSIVYFISVLMVSKYRDILEPPIPLPLTPTSTFHNTESSPSSDHNCPEEEEEEEEEEDEDEIEEVKEHEIQISVDVHTPSKESQPLMPSPECAGEGRVYMREEIVSPDATEERSLVCDGHSEDQQVDTSPAPDDAVPPASSPPSQTSPKSTAAPISSIQVSPHHAVSGPSPVAKENRPTTISLATGLPHHESTGKSPRVAADLPNVRPPTSSRIVTGIPPSLCSSKSSSYQATPCHSNSMETVAISNCVVDNTPLTTRLEDALGGTAPLLREILIDFSAYLSKTLVGSNGRELLPGGLGSLKQQNGTGSVVELVMLLCSQEWQNSLQKHAGLAFIELVNEGRLISHATREHIVRVANEAEFILSRMRAEDVHRHAEFDRLALQSTSQSHLEESLCLHLIDSGRRRDAKLADIIERDAVAFASKQQGVWEVPEAARQNFFRLDMWEDDSRRRRRFIADPNGTSYHEATLYPQSDSGPIVSRAGSVTEDSKSLSTLPSADRHLSNCQATTGGSNDESGGYGVRDDDLTTSATTGNDSSSGGNTGGGHNETQEQNTDFDIDGRITLSTSCSLMSLGVLIKGILSITKSEVSFEMDQDNDINERLLCYMEHVHGRWHFTEIRAVFSRRYLQKNIALEIFMANRTAVFFVFPDQSTARRVVFTLPRVGIGSKYGLLQRHKTSLGSPRQLFHHANMTQRWQQREITNFDYLMFLNTLAGRTYNDLNQWPVFPWILSNYDSEELDLSQPTNFRDLSRPIGAINSTRQAFFESRYREAAEEGRPTYHYGVHYSSPPIVINSLLRVQPFTQLHIQMQGGKFDHPDRLFHSVSEMWRNCQRNTADVKELIPEMFYLPEMLENSNRYRLGVREDGEAVDNVILPKWARTPEEFVRVHRQALESELVSCQLHQWIDLIFGYKQRGPEAVRATNVFHPLTYEGNVDWAKITDPILRRAIEDQIRHFGQIPSQLLSEPHPPRNSALHVSPLMFSTPQEDVAMVMKFLSHSPVIHISANTHPSASPPAILTLTQGHNFAVNKWNNTVATSFHQHASLGTSHSHNSEQQPQMPLTMDPMLAQVSSKRQIGDNFDVRLQVTDALFCTTPDNKVLFACGYWDKSIRVYAVESSRLMQVAYGHFGVVTCISMSDSGMHQDAIVVSGSQDCTVLLWIWSHRKQQIIGDFPGTDYPTPRATLTGHQDEISCVAVSSELGIVLSGAKDGTCLLHTDKGVLLRRLPPPSPTPCQPRLLLLPREGPLTVLWNTDSLVTYTLNAKIISQAHLSPESPASLTSLSSIPPSRVNALHSAANGSLLVVGSQDGRCRVLCSHRLTTAHTFPVCDAAISSIDITHDERFLIAGLSTGCLVVLNFNVNRWLHSDSNLSGSR